MAEDGARLARAGRGVQRGEHLRKVVAVRNLDEIKAEYGELETKIEELSFGRYRRL